MSCGFITNSFHSLDLAGVALAVVSETLQSDLSFFTSVNILIKNLAKGLTWV